MSKCNNAFLMQHLKFWTNLRKKVKVITISPFHFFKIIFLSIFFSFFHINLVQQFHILFSVAQNFICNFPDLCAQYFSIYFSFDDSHTDRRLCFPTTLARASTNIMHWMQSFYSILDGMSNPSEDLECQEVEKYEQNGCIKSLGQKQSTYLEFEESWC